MTYEIAPVSSKAIAPMKRSAVSNANPSGVAAMSASAWTGHFAPSVSSQRSKSAARSRAGSIGRGSDLTASHRFGRADSQETERLAERDLDALYEPQPRLGQRGVRVIDDAVVAIEPMERARELERVDGQEMHAAMRDDLAEQLRELLHETDHLALPGRGEQLQIRTLGRHPALPRCAEDARDPRVRVLHVIDGVVVRLLHGQLEIEIERRVRAALQQEEPRDIRTDRVEHVLEEQELSGAPAHALEHTLLQETHVLVEQHLETRRVDADRRERDLHLLQVVLRVRAPDVQLQIDATLLEAETVIGDVRRQIFRIADLVDKDPSLVGLVAPQSGRLGRLEEDDAVALGDDAALSELVDRLVEIPRDDEGRLLVPGIEPDAELSGDDALGVGDDPVDRHRGERLGLLIELELAVAGPVGLLDLHGDVLHVLALVAVGRHLDAFAEELAVADRDRDAEALHLRTDVLDVVLARDVRAGEREDVG